MLIKMEMSTGPRIGENILHSYGCQYDNGYYQNLIKKRWYFIAINHVFCPLSFSKTSTILLFN